MISNQGRKQKQIKEKLKTKKFGKAQKLLIALIKQRKFTMQERTKMESGQSNGRKKQTVRNGRKKKDKITGSKAYGENNGTRKNKVN